MSSFGFKNTWELNGYSKDGELKYSSKFPNLVTNVGKRWFLTQMYHRYDLSFTEEQAIGVYASYVHPDPDFGQYVRLMGPPIYDEEGNTRDIYGHLFTNYSGDNSFAPSECTTTPLITDTITLTIDPDLTCTIYNVFLEGVYNLNGVDCRRLYSISALPEPFLWEDEGDLEITYTIEAYNTT